MSVSDGKSEELWEDVDTMPIEIGGPRTKMDLDNRPPSPSESVSVSGSTRRRRPTKTVFVATNAGSSPRKQQQRPPRRVRPSKGELVDGVVDGGLFAGTYIFDVVSQAVHLLRRPLGILLFLWLLAHLLVRVQDTLARAFSPLCIIPGIGSAAWCRGPVRGADYPKMMEVQGDRFEQLLENGVGGSTLSGEIKLAQMATTDLVTLVRVSDLRSRDLLAESLVDFVNDAKKTGRGLQKLGAKIAGSVDQIFAVNDHALHTIQGALDNAPGRYSLSSLVPWRMGPTTNEIVQSTFEQAMSVLSSQMTRLIVEADISLRNLDALEERLTTLHEVVLREDSTISDAKAELLAVLWTKLGGNRKALRGHDNHLFLLKNLGGYRKTALAHVVSALQTLQAMSDDMEDLRERVSAPEITGEKISVQVHIGSIKNGLERLREGRTKAKEREEEAVRRIMGSGFDE